VDDLAQREIVFFVFAQEKYGSRKGAKFHKDAKKFYSLAGGMNLHL